MLSKEELARYSRHLSLSKFGTEGQEKLKCAKVLMIGAGGLGCPALQYLTAAGIGEIGIVDFDKVDISNLQRQILYSTEDIGSSKAETAAKKLSKQNPFVKFNVHNLKLDNKNALDIFKAYDLIIDGSDNFATRYLVNDVCVLLNKPLVYGSIFKFEGQVSVFNFSAKGGSAFGGNNGPTYRCVFPEPPESSPNCSEVGVIGVLPGIIGMIQATEAIKIITGIGETLSGRLLLFDAMSMNFNSMIVTRTEEGANASPKNETELLKMDYEYFCERKIDSFLNTISVNELHSLIEKKEKLQLLDVREINEQPKIEELSELQIPLKELSSKLNLITTDKKVIVFCQSGTRSKRAIEILEKEFPSTTFYSLQGGINEWVKAFELK